MSLVEINIDFPHQSLYNKELERKMDSTAILYEGYAKRHS